MPMTRFCFFLGHTFLFPNSATPPHYPPNSATPPPYSYSPILPILLFPQIKDVVRRYPESIEICIATVAQLPLMAISEPEARAAYIYLLGEHGALVRLRGGREREIVMCYIERERDVRYLFFITFSADSAFFF